MDEQIPDWANDSTQGSSVPDWAREPSDADTTTPLTSQALKETDSLGVRGGPAQGILGRFFGLRDPMVGPDGKVRKDLEPRMAAYQQSIQNRGFSPLVGELAETGARMEALPLSVGMQALPPTHPVRQTMEGYFNAVRGTATELSSEDNLALMAATAGLGGPGVSAASRIGGRAISGAFAAQIASSMPEQWRAFKAAPDLKTKTSMALQMLTSAGLVGAAGKHAIMGERVPPPLEPDVTIPTDPEGQMTMLKEGLKRGDLTREQFDDLAARVQQAPVPAAQPAAPAAQPAEGVVSETARVASEPGPEAGVEAPPKEAPQGAPEEATARLNEVTDRFGIYGLKHQPILEAAAEAKGGKLTPGEAADALEAHEENLPKWKRHRAMAEGKTFGEINTELQWTDFIREKIQEQDQRLEKERGILISSTQPAVQVDALPEGGWKVTVGPREQNIQIPPEKKGEPTFQKRTVPQAELYLSPKGELIPYANRPNTPTNAVPDVQGKPPVRGTEKPTQTGGPREAPPQGAGAQPQPATQRSVAPEAAPPKAEQSRYVVENLFDPKTRKQTGSIVKDQTTGKVVEKFQSPERNPNAEDLLAMKDKAQQHADKLAQEPVLVTGKKKRFKVGTVVFDEYANSPETPVATAISEMGGIKSKTAAMDQGKYKGNEALWDTPIKFSHLSHQKVYDPSGEMPDVMAQNLHNAGLIHEPSVEAMRVALEKESAGVRSKVENAPEKQAGVAAQMKQAENFGKGQRQEGPGKAIAVDSLSIGDKVNVDGTDLKVTNVAPDGIVTLEDGKRYGVQQVTDGDVIYGEVTPQEAAPKTESSATTEPTTGKPSREEIGGREAQLPEVDLRNVGPHGQKALNTSLVNPIAARKAAFVREGSHHVHKDTGLIIRHNKERGLFEVVHPETGEILDTGPTRRDTIDKHLDGLPRKAPLEPPPTTAEGEPEYDFTTMEGFEKAVEDRFGRKLTEADRKAFEPIMKKVTEAKTDASDIGSMAFNKLLQYFHDVKDIPFEDAVDQIKKAIEDATGPCS